MDLRILFRSATDWSMDNVWAAILDQLKLQKPDLWNQLYSLTREHGTLTRTTIAGIMQAAGWMKDVLPFLPDNLKSLGDDVLAQSAGAITNYFLRQPAPTVRVGTSTKEVPIRLKALAPDLREYLKAFSFSDEARFPSAHALDVTTRLRAIFGLRHPDKTGEDLALLDQVCDWIGSLPPRALKSVQIIVEDSEALARRIKEVESGEWPEQLAKRYRGQWEDNAITRQRLKQMMATESIERERMIFKALPALVWVKAARLAA